MKSSFETQTVAPPDLLSDQKAGPLTGHGVENALARLEVDLSAELFFQRQSLVLSPRGLNLFDVSASPPQSLGQWPLNAGLRMQHSDRIKHLTACVQVALCGNGLPVGARNNSHAR